MPFKEWSTTYTGATPVQDPDPITGSQPDVEDNPASVPREPGTGDNTRTSHVLTLRNKVQTLAKYVGDSNNDPSGSLRDKVSTLETDAASAIHDDVKNEINLVTLKATPHTDDVLLIEDSEDEVAPGYAKNY